MSNKTLTIIIPFYNEVSTLPKILEKVIRAKLIGDLQKEIILVDDASTDGSRKVAEEFLKSQEGLNHKLFVQKGNQGKGASIQLGIRNATGDFLIVQDADLEYDPDEYSKLLEPALADKADVVYGSRFMGGEPHRILFFWHSIGNKFLTGLSNMFTNLNLSDMETCYKLFRTDLIKSIKLKEKRFGFEPEVTAKIARIKGVRIYEVGISYFGRTYEEGKKINWKDGLRAIYCILKYNIFN